MIDRFSNQIHNPNKYNWYLRDAQIIVEYNFDNKCLFSIDTKLLWLELRVECNYTLFLWRICIYLYNTNRKWKHIVRWRSRLLQHAGVFPITIIIIINVGKKSNYMNFQWNKSRLHVHNPSAGSLSGSSTQNIKRKVLFDEAVAKGWRFAKTYALRPNNKEPLSFSSRICFLDKRSLYSFFFHSAPFFLTINYKLFCWLCNASRLPLSLPSSCRRVAFVFRNQFIFHVKGHKFMCSYNMFKFKRQTNADCLLFS
jgi:hypothetical protein